MQSYPFLLKIMIKDWILTSPLGLHRIVVQFGAVLNLSCSFQRKSDGD